jgi:hypothetical protein
MKLLIMNLSLFWRYPLPRRPKYLPLLPEYRVLLDKISKTKYKELKHTFRVK